MRCINKLYLLHPWWRNCLLIANEMFFQTLFKRLWNSLMQDLEFINGYFSTLINLFDYNLYIPPPKGYSHFNHTFLLVSNVIFDCDFIYVCGILLSMISLYIYKFGTCTNTGFKIHLHHYPPSFSNIITDHKIATEHIRCLPHGYLEFYVTLPLQNHANSYRLNPVHVIWDNR